MLKRLALLGVSISLASLFTGSIAQSAQLPHGSLVRTSPVALITVQRGEPTRSATNGMQRIKADVRIDAGRYDTASFLISVVLAVVGVLGIIVAVCSLYMLWRQALTARVSAEAALKQAQHIIISERAWVIPIPESPNPPFPNNSLSPHVTEVLVKFCNKGKTPAFLGKISTGACIIPRNELPDLDGRLLDDNLNSAPLVPEHQIPWNHPRIQTERGIKIRTGDQVLWIYGTVEYKDAFDKCRRTDFCFRWVPVNESGMSEWVMDGPRDSNRAA